MDINALRQFIANKNPRKLVTEQSAAATKALEHLNKALNALFAHDLGSAEGEESLEHIEDALAALKGDPILNTTDRRYNRPLSAHINDAIKDFDNTLSARKADDVKEGLMELRYQIEDIIRLIQGKE